MSNLLHLQEAHDGLYLRVIGAGLHVANEAALTQALFALSEQHSRQRWILDLGGVEALGASILMDLLRLDLKLRAAGGRLSLRNLNPLFYEVYHICRRTEVLAVEAPA